MTMQEEDDGYKGGSEANLGEADDTAGDSNIKITDGKKLRVKEAKQAVSDYVSKVAKLGRAARKTRVEHVDHQMPRTKTLHR